MSDIPEHDPRAIAVMSALRTGDVDALRRLLHEHADLPAAWIAGDDGVRRSLLHVLADWPGHFPNAAQSARILIDAGADVNARVSLPDTAETPLHWAASSDDVPLIDALLDGGADLEADGAVFTGGTPMSDAVVFAQWNAARRLLERGARTTLWQAAALGLVDRVGEYFAGAAPHEREITNALWHACRGGQHATAQSLFERGGQLDWVGHEGKTPRQLALESEDDALLEWLRSTAG